MADFWGVITTTTDGYDLNPSTGAGKRRKRKQVLGVGVTSGKTSPPILLNVDHLDWQADAACTGMDRDLFFDDDDAYVEQLRPICDSCPVRQACLDQAYANGEVGFWGGLTSRERRRVRERERSRARRAERAAG